MNIPKREELKKWRKEAGLTQRELAEKAGISLSSITKYETGEREPKLKQLNKILSVLNMEEIFADKKSTEGEPVFNYSDFIERLKNLSPKNLRRINEYLLILERLEKLGKRVEETNENFKA